MAPENQPWLGDDLAHMSKTGGQIRSTANDELIKLASYIPRSIRGVPVEYDLSYSLKEPHIRGYKVTDLLTKCLWLAPCNVGLSVNYLTKIIAQGPTDEGRAIMELVSNSIEDKYLNRKVAMLPERIAVLPGSNIIAVGGLDFNKLNAAVEEGAYIKPHPVTNPLDIHRLKEHYGDRVLPEKAQLYPMLKEAQHVYFCTSSEVGFVAGMWKKPFSILDGKPKDRMHTFFELYRSVDAATRHAPLYEKLAALFSHPESGFISVYHPDPKEAIERFFGYYGIFSHGR